MFVLSTNRPCFVDRRYYCRLNFEDRIAAEIIAFKNATDTIVVANHHPDHKSSMMGVFSVARSLGTFVCHAVNVRVISLNGVDLQGG